MLDKPVPRGDAPALFIHNERTSVMDSATRRRVGKGYPLRNPDVDGFDVVCKVGRVSFNDKTGMPPHVAAFQLIAEHDAPGVYSFPMPDGRTCSVDVAFEDPEQQKREQRDYKP
jgi:hypothetical protein